ncbi:hypothetical protein EVG20_g10855 [Dentipellis fragilis]|uniref:chitin deacetylase n=1 Tax=Dentipellis fragilis TaxID=205917 RepID=A0A4Y9XT76_9AGAM|nr:hypothetical protein EVG20_g10855 [Dentipellis fragilis]
MLVDITRMNLWQWHGAQACEARTGHVSSIPEPRTMGFSFDDGPNCLHNAFYDILQQNNHKPTMFFVGSNVMGWSLEAQCALTGGHEIYVHTRSHRYMTSSKAKTHSPSTRSVSLLILHESAHPNLMPTCLQMKAIKLVTGVVPTCQPYCIDHICAITNVLKLHKIIWKYNLSDWRACMGSVMPADVSLDYIAITDWTLVEQEGGIVLTHELNNFTMSEVVKFYPQLQAAFSHIVLIGVALKSHGYISDMTNKTGGSNGSSSSGSCSSNKNGSSSSDAQEKSVTTAHLAALVLLLAGVEMGLLASLMLRAATLDMVTWIPNTDTDTIPAILILRPDSPLMVA